MEHYRQFGRLLKPKYPYETQDAAIDDAKIINTKSNQIYKVVPYRCSICNKFHLGKNKTVIKHNTNMYE